MPKFKKTISLIIFLSITLLFFIALINIQPVYADKSIAMNLQVGLPGFGEKGAKINVTPDTLGKYIKAIYTYAIGIVGIFSTVVIIYGGLLWAMAGGNNSKVDAAKGYIGSALTGLVLALVSYTLLYMINPALVELKPIVLTKVVPTITCCDPQTGAKNATAKPNTKPIQYICPTGTQTCAKEQTCAKISTGGDYECISNIKSGCCRCDYGVTHTCKDGNTFITNQSCKDHCGMSIIFEWFPEYKCNAYLNCVEK
ncbi:MAG: hypothetical protein KAJ48_02380 [Elusimicrobiales bacterium]|nr:hypothetical protein [Elusimicrobiales bacterium]